MQARTKRTYNLRPESIRRVRELSADYGVAESQDAVVEIAIERLYGDVVAEREAQQWASAAEDAGFRSEMAQLEQEFRDREAWPR